MTWGIDRSPHQIQPASPRPPPDVQSGSVEVRKPIEMRDASSCGTQRRPADRDSNPFLEPQLDEVDGPVREDVTEEQPDIEVDEVTMDSGSRRKLVGTQLCAGCR